MPIILATLETEMRRITVQSQPGQITLIGKNPIQNRTCGVTQAVEGLPSKFEALSSNHSTAKKKKKER
jgi:hypothetical protein